jgi:hypothetical protein
MADTAPPLDIALVVDTIGLFDEDLFMERRKTERTKELMRNI